LVISDHAVQRYRERVDPAATELNARLAMARIVTTGTVCPRPRRWTRVAGYRAGTSYVYSAEAPGICVAVRDGMVRTIFSRRVCARWRQGEVATTSMRRFRERRLRRCEAKRRICTWRTT
jgi:hypothetical protein